MKNFFNLSIFKKSESVTSNKSVKTPFQFRLSIILSVLLMMFSVNMWGTEVTFTWGTNPSAYESGSSDFYEGDVHFVGGNNSGNTATRAWSDGLRIYNGGTATFTAPTGCKITSITGYTAFNYSNATGENSVTFTGLSKTTCKSDVTVTYDGGGSTEYTVTLDKNGSTSEITGCTGTYTLPTSGEEHTEDACDGWVWHCWANAAYAESTTAPSSTKITTMSSAGTAYAVYKHTEGGGGSSTSTFVASAQGWGNGAAATTKTIDGVTYSFDQNGGSNAPKFYTSSNGVHLYPKNKITINAGSGTISSIVFTFSRNDGWSASTGTWNSSTSTWTGSSSSVTFTVTNTSGYQVRITSIEVTTGGGTTTTYTSTPDCVECLTKVTLTKGEESNGAFTLSKSNGTYNNCTSNFVVTVSSITPADGYYCTGVTATGGANVVVTGPDGSGNYTVTYTKENNITSTITANFEAISPRTYTFVPGTGTCATSSLTESVWNAGVTLPMATANSGCDPEYIFAGWATAAVTETTTSPTLYTAGTTYNGSATTLYAVYVQVTGGGSGFTLSCTIDDVTYYATAREGSNTFMGASTDDAEAAQFSIVTSNTKQYLCWHNGTEDTYVYNSTKDAKLKFTSDLSSASAWNVTETETTITLEASNGRKFLINNSLKDRFAAYSRDESLTKTSSGTTTYNSFPSCICYSVDITYNANGGTLAEGCSNITGGDCERDWKLCDAPTREDFMFTGWKDQNGNLYSAGANVTNLKTSLTLTAQWIPMPYTVLFDAGSGSSVESLTESSRGDGIILPTAEPSAACSDDWTFVGWSETKLIGETNTSATIIGASGIPYIPSANNTTLYAVYNRIDESSASYDYTRISSSTPAEGDYVVVVGQGLESFGLLTYGTTDKGRLTYTKAYTTLPATKISSPAATQIWHLSYDASGYAYLFNTDAEVYLSAVSTYNITYNANSGSAFVFTRAAGSYGDYSCLNNTASSSTNYYLGANKEADYIRYYGTSNIISSSCVTLYKGSTGTRYYSTEPACTPCIDPEWSFELGTSIVKTKGSEPFTNTIIKGHESLGAVTYSSTNEEVATVDNTGLVTLLGAGSTTIKVRLAKAMPYCATALQYELEVKEPFIDIVGVTAAGNIIVEHDLEGDLKLDLSEGQAISTGTAANDLFFSKYFEAASNMKLFAIFNGTGHDVDLKNIRVRCNCTTSGTGVWPTKTGDLGYVELRTVSKLRELYPKLKIPSGTELIFWSNNKGSNDATRTYNTYLRNCVEINIGDMTYRYSDMEAQEIPNWFCLGDYTTYNTKDADGNNQFVFNGDDSMILERYNETTGEWEAIDVFGAGTSDAPASTTGLVEEITTKYTINGKSQPLNDDAGFHAKCAGITIPLSTNRYMLVRKNTVLDGYTAVESNKTSFATLCSEWDGTPVGGDKGSSADNYCHSGEMFSAVGEFDYAENYTRWDIITDDKYETETKEDGTVYVTFTGVSDLFDRACTLLKMEVVRDNGGEKEVLAKTEYKIPIVVKENNVLTTADLFTAQGSKCSTCDVAILKDAVLTKANDGATNDMPEVRDIYVYGGGKLIIPSGTNYKAHDLILRMQVADDKINMNVPNVLVTGSLINQYGGGIRQQARIGTNRFYQFAVPYSVRLDDVTFSDGSPAVYGEDFMIRYYDGEQRAENLGTASNWLNYNGTELQPGIGYTLAVAKKAGHSNRELIFPLEGASLEEGEPDTKATTIHAWGDNTIRANHRGWNFLSNPYLTTYAKNNLYGDAGEMLTTGQLVPDPEHPGWWVNNGNAIPYVTLINSTRTDYTQERVSLQELKPFTTFFVQAGDDSHNNGAEFSLTFDRTHRKTSAPAYIRTEQKSSVARFGVLLTNDNTQDNCGVVVGENYSATYDMQADLSKEFGSAYSLKLYTLQEDQMQMAFLATHPDSLNKPIPVGVRLPMNAEYNFSIDRRYDLGAFSHIYLTDNATGKHVDLLDETYSFSGTREQNDNRFSLFVELRKDTQTGIQNLLNGIYAVGREGSLMLTGLPEKTDIYIYDMAGRMVTTRHTYEQSSVTYLLPCGVYQIRIIADGAGTLLRAIVY